MRYGLADWLTLEGHAEAGADLLNGGAGIAFPTGRWGSMSLAAAGSRHAGASGLLLNGALELSYNSFRAYGRLQQTFGSYDDVGSVSAATEDYDNYLRSFYSARVPRALAQVSVSAPAFDRSSISLSYTQIETDNRDRNRIASISYSQTLFKNTSLFTTAFTDLDDGDSFGIFAGLSVPFDNDIYVSTGFDQSESGSSGYAEISKSARSEVGSFGWRARTREGDVADRSVSANYRGKIARVEGQVRQYDDSVQVNGWIDGAIAVAGGGVFATNRINDAFAVVDVGAPDVEVRSQNNLIGRTDSGGRLIVPDLSSWQPNQIDIDPINLPVDAAIGSTRSIIVPANRGGVVVDFNVKANPAGAIVTLVDEAGKPLDAGLEGKIAGSENVFVVGYDGEAFVQGLSARNEVIVNISAVKTCHAAFPYDPQPGTQVLIKNVVCR
jgi:outer membrane usher protein